MAKLYFRYGLGKSAQLCQVAYNYINERNMPIAILNAYDNEMVRSNVLVDGKCVLQRDINITMSNSSNLYEKIYYENESYVNSRLYCVLVDNCEYLTEKQAEELFFVSKILDIPVICYGNRLINGIDTSFGVCRLMSLADDIENINHNILHKKANLTFNYGAMNCSKTAQLLIENQSLINNGLKTCLIKPKLDRDELYIMSRIGLKKEANIVLDKNDVIYGQAEYLYRDRVNHILIDEVQFLTTSQINQLRRIVDDYNIPVTCYGLKTDFLSNLFSGSKRLLEISDNIFKMNTVCSCGKGASFNVRKDKYGNYVTKGEQIVIDDGGNYDSECAMCFIEHVMGIDTKVKSRIKKK